MGGEHVRNVTYIFSDYLKLLDSWLMLGKQLRQSSVEWLLPPLAMIGHSHITNATATNTFKKNKSRRAQPLTHNNEEKKGEKKDS